ncbi:MAG: acetyl-CoA hydrolase/transferase C-terminal domain-containing protein, partial [Dehalococcoidia bacterium]
DVYAHVSEFDAFVPFTPPSLDIEGFRAAVAGTGKEDEYAALYEHASPSFWGTVAGVLRAVSPVDLARLLGVGDPPDEAKGIAEHLKALIHDRDTIQIGTGEPGRNMPNLGVFDERQDLGLHTELGSPGYGRLVREGIITNKYKTLHPGKSIAAAWTGVAEDDLRYIAGNPLFELYDPSYVLHMRTILQIENFVAINNGISIDFLGQINSESVFGPRLINGLGGQPDAHIGAMYAKGGRAITLLPSTALGGSVSRIVPMMPEGSYCTIPRFYADYVVTEFGVARLFGKTHRERAEELISVAHPDHKADLREALKGQLFP